MYSMFIYLIYLLDVLDEAGLAAHAGVSLV